MSVSSCVHRPSAVSGRSWNACAKCDQLMHLIADLNESQNRLIQRRFRLTAFGGVEMAMADECERSLRPVRGLRSMRADRVEVKFALLARSIAADRKSGRRNSCGRSGVRTRR